MPSQSLSSPENSQDWRASNSGFDAWFSGSLAAHADGSPLVVYHGTAHDVNVFKPAQAHDGIYFTDNAETADEYADIAIRDGESIGPVVYAVHLSIKNPLVISNDDLMFTEETQELLEATIAQARREGRDGVILRAVDDHGACTSSDMYVVLEADQIRSALGHRLAFGVDKGQEPQANLFHRMSTQELEALRTTGEWVLPSSRLATSKTQEGGSGDDFGPVQAELDGQMLQKRGAKFLEVQYNLDWLDQAGELVYVTARTREDWMEWAEEEYPDDDPKEVIDNEIQETFGSEQEVIVTLGALRVAEVVNADALFLQHEIPIDRSLPIIEPNLTQPPPLRNAVETALQNPAFQEWFKNSHVLDDHGRPLMVFHGTYDDFCIFGQSEDGGYHFGTESAAGRRLADLGGDECAEGARVMPMFLSIQNPKTLPKDPFGCEDWQEAIRLAIAEGHDGIRYPNSVEFDEDIEGNPLYTESWVAFEPGQIKNAISNSGSYNRLDPDTTDRRANAEKALEWLQRFAKKAAPHA